jgi:uncharacterized protein
MSPKIDVITLGVTDLQRARRFYEKGFGGAVQEEQETLRIRLGANASRLALRPWDAVAADAGVAPRTTGFRGFTLSYIIDTADSVDQVLARAELHGGVISKPPKNALWGYSAYITDPSGYLWKVASAKRRPLIAAKQPSAVNGRAIEPQEVPITIGVADMKRAKEFYKDGLGLTLKKDYRKFVMFSGVNGTSDLGVYKRDALADDAAVKPDGGGFRGFSITSTVDSAGRVDALLAQAARAGGSIVTAGRPTGHGEYSGYFADPDGNLWRVASGG